VRNGWTYWSFVYSKSAQIWLDLLTQATGPVYAFCSDSPGARDPDNHRGTRLATHHRNVGAKDWLTMPDPGMVKVTNPFKRQGLALAFKIKRVITFQPVIPPFGIEWYSKQDQRWRVDTLPTRGEFLIRRGGNVPPRRISALLELVPPYLVELKHEPKDANANND